MIAVPRGAALTNHDICVRTTRALGDPLRLDIIPWSPELVQLTAVDVRLGHRFSVPDPAVGVIDAAAGAPERSYRHIFVNKMETMLLKPGEFVLASTLEFIATPCDVVTFVEGKSRLGRLGLLVATATQVAPGFHGCIVLELANLGAFELTLRPGMSIAQLIFIAATAVVAPYGSGSSREYDCQIGP